MYEKLQRALRPAARWLPVVGWMAFITYWSAQSDLPINHPRITELFNGLQHPLAHAAAFGILGGLARWALDSAPRAWLWAWMLAATFGALDEWHQSFTPGRTPDVQDWLIDAAAAGVAVLAVSVALRLPLRAPSMSAARAVYAGGALSFGLAAVMFLAVLALPISPRQTAESVASRATRVIDRVVPNRVQDRTLNLARGAVDAARSARAELRARLSG